MPTPARNLGLRQQAGVLIERAETLVQMVQDEIHDGDMQGHLAEALQRLRMAKKWLSEIGPEPEEDNSVPF